MTTMSWGWASVMKELHKLLQQADKLYDGQVEFDKDIEENNKEEDLERCLRLAFFITPKDGLYKDARIKFNMSVDLTRYPATAPQIKCCNSVYHPNIDVLEGCDEADICVSLLEGDWEPEVGLDGAVMAVLFLLYNPQLDDSLSNVDNFQDYDEYERKVRRTLRGERIGDFIFDKLIDDQTSSDDTERSTSISHSALSATATPTVSHTVPSTSSPHSSSSPGNGEGHVVCDENGTNALSTSTNDGEYETNPCTLDMDNNTMLKRYQAESSRNSSIFNTPVFRIISRWFLIFKERVSPFLYLLRSMF